MKAQDNIAIEAPVVMDKVIITRGESGIKTKLIIYDPEPKGKMEGYQLLCKKILRIGIRTGDDWPEIMGNLDSYASHKDGGLKLTLVINGALPLRPEFLYCDDLFLKLIPIAARRQNELDI